MNEINEEYEKATESGEESDEEGGEESDDEDGEEDDDEDGEGVEETTEDFSLNLIQNHSYTQKILYHKVMNYDKDWLTWKPDDPAQLLLYDAINKIKLPSVTSTLSRSPTN